MEPSFRSRSFALFEHSRKGTRSNTRIVEVDPMDLNEKEMQEFVEIRKILNVPPFKRNKGQLMWLKQFFLSTEYFKCMNCEEIEEIVYECAKFAKHYYSALRTIPLNIKEEIKRFYLILSGNVRVLNGTATQELEKKQWFGESYYEIPSEYTQAVCLTPSHFIVLDSIDFKRIHDHILHKKFNIVLKFLGTIPILNTLSRKYIARILSFFRVKKYKRKEFLFREKETCEFVYFIDSGEFIISKNSRLSSMSPKRISEVPRYKEYITTQRLGIIGKGELVGDEDILNSLGFRSYSCECYSESGKVLYISAKDFFASLAKTEEIVEILKKRVKAKEFSRNKIHKVSSEVLKLRLPSPKPPLPDLFSPRSHIREVLTRSGHSTPIRSPRK